MPSRTALFFLGIVAVLAVAGCGSSTKKAIVLTGTRSSAGPELKYPPVRSASYTVSLSGANGVSGPLGAPPGAPNGSGLAVISVDAPKRRLCWKFSQLENVPAPTVARVYYRPAGRFAWMFGLRLGRAYKASGCIPTPEGTQSIEYSPQDWWVSIHNAEFRGGAVRGQL